MNTRSKVLLSYAFRPFFLLNGLFAIVVMLAWILSLHGAGDLRLTPWWHAHEMLVGFGMASVAGFSLTAVSVWTGHPAVHGWPLGVLVSCWLAGRLGMAIAGQMPATVVALLDMLFPLLLCGLLGRELLASGNRRNYPVLAVLVLMAVFNAVYHLGATGRIPGAQGLALQLLLHAQLFLVVVIAGRITPSFTGNWLRSRGEQRLPNPGAGIDRAAVLLTLATGLAVAFATMHVLTALLAMAAAVAHALRLGRWRGWATRSNPLLFVLHAAYAWLPVGYILTGLSVLGWGVSPSAAVHALSMGAIGSMVLAVTTRVALGHTGRPLMAARATVFAYWIMVLAVLARILGAVPGLNTMLMMDMAAIGWIAVFAIFSWVYWPILTGPRAD